MIQDLVRTTAPSSLETVQQPLDELLQALEEIKRAGITHTNRLPTGEYGEWIACHLLDLIPAKSKVAKGGDATDAEGYRYEVKTQSIKVPDRVPSITGRNAGEFDFLVVVSLTPAYEFERIRLVPAERLIWKGNTFRFGPNQVSAISWELASDHVPASKRSELSSADSTMRSYKESLQRLLKLGAVRSEKTISADLGEFFAACYFRLQLADNLNEPGYDALDRTCHRFQIKTRLPTPTAKGGSFQDCFTTYTSFDFGKKLLEAREFDSLLACFLDSRLRPISFLLVPHSVVLKQIQDRASRSGRLPSLRFRWNWKQFRKSPLDGVALFLTQSYRHHVAALEPNNAVRLLPF